MCLNADTLERVAWGRQLASTFACLISNEGSGPLPDTWAILFFELLLHSHGLNPESHWNCEYGEIWSLDESFVSDLNQRSKAIRTPMRRNRSNLTTTPRRSLTRHGLIKATNGVSLKRNLFRPTISEPSSIFLSSGPSFLATKDGKEFVPSPSSGESLSIDRETYSKRLRVK
jgi:hypothetical protein